MPRFIQGTTGNSHEPSIILEVAPPGSLRDIRSNTIRGTYQLLPDGIASQNVPVFNNLPNLVRELLGQLIDPQILKIRSSHPVPRFLCYGPRTKDYGLTRTLRPMRQVARHRHAQRRIGAQLHIVDILVTAAAAQVVQKAFDLFQVARAQRARVGQ